MPIMVLIGRRPGYHVVQVVERDIVELAEYLRIMRRDWAIAVAFVVVGCALGVGLTFATTPVYEASVRLFVATSTNNSATASDLAQGNNFTQNRVQSYTDLATSPA